MSIFNSIGENLSKALVDYLEEETKNGHVHVGGVLCVKSIKRRRELSEYIEEKKRIGSVTELDIDENEKLIDKDVWEKLPLKAQQVLSKNGFHVNRIFLIK